MRLVISRDQAQVKGVLGGNKGVNFTLAYKLILSEQEAEVVDRYRLWEYAVTLKKVGGNTVADDTIRNMTQGRQQTVADVTTLVRNEETIKDACDSLVALLQLMETFGGREVIDYPRVPA